jgi:NitT/TauT family transport system permease protein
MEAPVIKSKSTVPPPTHRSLVPEGVRQAWVPNGKVSGNVYALLVTWTTLAIFALWMSVRSSFIPSPVDVLKVYPSLFNEGLGYQLYVSLSTNIQAILLSCALTLPLAYLTVLPALRPLVRALSKTRFLGLTGFVITFTVTFGGGHGLKVALLVFGMSMFLVTSLYDIVEAIPREEFDHARTLRMGPWRSTYEVVIRGRLDAVLDVIRQNAAMGWVMLTMVEGLVRSEGGLGAMMLAEDKHMRLDAVAAIQVVVLVLGIVQDALFLLLRKTVCPYADVTLERK